MARTRTSASLAAACLAALVLSAPAGAAVAPAPGEKPAFDARGNDPLGSPSAAERAARHSLRSQLGPKASVAGDSAAITVAGTGELLTPPSGADPATIALDYVRAHEDVFAVDATDLAGLTLVRRYSTWDGTTYLMWAPVVAGVRATDSDVRAAVTRNGRLISVSSRLQHDFGKPSTDPSLNAGEALAAASRDVGATGLPPRAGVPSGRDRRTRFSNGAQARLLLLGDAGGTRLAWSVVVSGQRPFLYRELIDAHTGALLKRQSLTDFANTATVWKLNPTGPPAESVDLSQWLEDPTTPTRLSGPNAHAWSDLNDDCSNATLSSCSGANEPDAGEDTGPSAGGNFNYGTTTFSPVANGFCPSSGCTWNFNTANSWQTNRRQSTTQLFYFVNEFHDHLAAPPIGFNGASGNFEGGDPVLAQSLDGANKSSGKPDGSHANNANFTTEPDGTPGLMQMYLWQSSGASHFSSVNGADDAEIVYHEYTHGLSSRLVTDSSGVAALDYTQPGAMGEAWSDWYAFDYLVGQSYLPDSPAPGDLNLGNYEDGGQHLIRSEPMDCSVGAPATACPGSGSAGSGGYTYGDMGRIQPGGGAEVHYDGEIWGQTLWDLRGALGSAVTERIVTDAMRLSSPQPAFLDMRDAILAADAADFGGAHYDAIWQVFASRGMGVRAVRVPADSFPARANEDFTVPPPTQPQTPAVDDPAPLGDGDGAAEPGETVRLTLPLRNSGSSPVSGISATLASSDPSVVVGQGSSTYPGTLAPGATAGNSTPYAVTIPNSVACGAPLPLTLTTSTSAGTAAAVAVPGTTGAAGTPVHLTQNAAVPINDSPVADSALAVAGVGPVKDVNLRIDSLTHTYDGDLAVALVQPGGNSAGVELISRPGGEFNDGDNFTNTVLDDQATGPRLGAPGTAPPYTGTFRPQSGSLAAFDGGAATGTWHLKVDDRASGDTGTLNQWGLDITPAVCSTTAPPPPSATTTAADGVSSSGATLHGDVTPGTTGDQYAFQYGPTTSYGSQTTPADAGAGAEQETLNGLTASATYHFRIVALRADTIVAVGGDRTFTVDGPPPAVAQTPAQTPLQPAQPPVKLSVTVRDSGAARARVRGARFTLPGLRFGCPAGAAACRVVVQATLGGQVLARGSSTIVSGRTASVTLKLTNKGRRLLRSRGRLTLKATATATASGGDPQKTPKRFVLRR